VCECTLRSYPVPKCVHGLVHRRLSYDQKTMVRTSSVSSRASGKLSVAEPWFDGSRPLWAENTGVNMTGHDEHCRTIPSF
jgi:hypothetical protein